MVNYSNGKIYKIINDENDDIYIGSTCNTLSVRMSQHKTNFIRYLNNLKQNYITSFKLLEIPSAKIILIENYPCNTKEELTAREAYYIRELNCVNRYIPLRTDAEYRLDNLEAITEKKKKYYEANKEYLLEKARKRREIEDKEAVAKYKREWYEVNKEAIISKSKARYEVNKEAIISKRKAYYEANKEQINARKREKRKNIKLNKELS